MIQRFVGGLIFVAVCCCGTVVNAQDVKPTRTIHLVYDDSGSMIRLGSSYVDTWCQAKYAMEVVAAMLDDGDALNIYYMSDYDNGMTAPPRIRLRGSQSPEIVRANVETIHQTITPFGNTPFAAVKKAHQDLKQASTDEKWLVVLTDGEFEDGKMSNNEVETYYSQVVADASTKVIMLAMGSEAATIKSHEEKGIFFEHASSTRDILPKLTEICNRIFQRNALKVLQNNANHRISFSVPMREIIVLAQGKNVTQAGTIQKGTESYAPSSAVHVRYSEVSSTQNPPGAIVADGLNGFVATYLGQLDPGQYEIRVDNVENLDVYYKPNVSIAAYLYDLDGNEVTEKTDIVNGKYQLKFGFVHAVTNEKVEDTALLGKIVYESTITNTASDGKMTHIQATSGDWIEIREGMLDIQVMAHYLDYNTVKTSLNYEVFFRNALVYELEEVSEYAVSKEGISNVDKPMRVTVKMKDGESLVELSHEQWDAMPLPKVFMKSKQGNVRIEKSGAKGVFELYPDFGERDPFDITDKELKFALSGGFEKGKSSAQGRLEASIPIEDRISSFERAVHWFLRHWIELLVWGMIAVIVWGYMPFVKKRFNRKIPHKIKGVKVNAFQTQTECQATFKKDFFSVILPYCSEKAIFSWPTVCHATRLRLKARKRPSISLENFTALNEMYVFGSQKIDKMTKKKKAFSFTDNDMITYKKVSDDGEEAITYRFTLKSKSKSK